MLNVRNQIFHESEFVAIEYKTVFTEGTQKGKYCKFKDVSIKAFNIEVRRSNIREIKQNKINLKAEKMRFFASLKHFTEEAIS